MVRINTNNNQNWKAASLSSEDEALLNKVQEAQGRLEELESGEYEEFLTEEQRAQLEYLKNMLAAEAAAIQAGNYSSATSGTGTDGESYNYNERDSLAALASGWDGEYTERDITAEDEARIGPDDGDLEAVIGVIDSGTSTPTAISLTIDDAFEEEFGEKVEKVLVRSDGPDLIVTIIGENGKRICYSLKDQVTGDATIIFNFTQLSHKIEFDAHRTFRMSDDGRNVVRGVVVDGSAYDDTLIGSQGNDIIIGWEGNDVIRGHAGADDIFGDEWYEYAGQYSVIGGDDDIDGGTGTDTIMGGYGYDTWYESDRNDAIDEVEGKAQDNVSGVSPGTGWISGDWTATDDGNGEIVVENQNSTPGGEIVLDMSQITDGDYYMAFGEMDGDDVVITIVGENGQTYKIRLKDFATSAPAGSPEELVKLLLKGTDGKNIFDMHNLVLPTNAVVNMEGLGDEDIMVAASNELLNAGIDNEKMTESNLNGGHSGLTDYADTCVVELTGEDNYTATATTDGEVVIECNDPTVPVEDRPLRIQAPEGFDNAYIGVDPNTGEYIVVLANMTTGETIVIRIDDATDLNYNQIIVGHMTEELDENDDEYSLNNKFGPAMELMPISFGDSNGNPDYYMDGGAGGDLMFGYSGVDFRNTDSDDEIIEIINESTLNN